MNVKYLISIVAITSYLVGSGAYASDKGQTEAAKKEQSPNIALQVKRDAASGLSTGKRLHKPVSMTAHVDKASPVMGDKGANPLFSVQSSKSGYKLCPDGTQIFAGEKCPEKKR